MSPRLMNCHVRDLRCLFKCVVLVNLAGHKEQYFVCGRDGTFPLCARMRDGALAVVMVVDMAQRVFRARTM
jgi:hypothetical protein